MRRGGYRVTYDEVSLSVATERETQQLRSQEATGNYLLQAEKSTRKDWLSFGLGLLVALLSIMGVGWYVKH